MDVNKITEYLDSISVEDIPSIDCIIYKDHEMMYRHFRGYKDQDKTIKMTGDELYLIYSATKPITMTAALQLIEKNKLDPDRPVADYLPAYKNPMVRTEQQVEPARKELLVKHLLSMQSGLDYDLNRAGIMRVLKERGSKATTQELVNAFIETPLNFEPGDHFDYSLSHDVIGAIIEVVSDLSLGEYMLQNIFEPIGMKDTFFAKPFNVNDRLVPQYMYDREKMKSSEMDLSCCFQLSDHYESGGAGLISSAEDYARFADMLACGGMSLNGARILKEESINRMRTNLLGQMQREEFVRKMGRAGFGYGYGVQMLLEPEQCNAKAPLGVFGWDGAAGTYVMADPSNRLSIVYTQHVRSCSYAYATIHPTLRDLLYT